MKETGSRICPSCNHGQTELFHKLSSFPVHSVINLSTREEAQNFPRGRIVLVRCDKCGFIWNAAFDPNIVAYSSNFEESQGFSETYSNFSRNQAARLVERYGLYNKTILEIGCGKGEFLALLCELGENRGIGFDPAFVPGRLSQEAMSRITFIPDYYSEHYAEHEADFICCRMTLEHIPETGNFLRMIRRTIKTKDKSSPRIFIQVPDVTRILRDCAFEDIYYDHCSYFSPLSLRYLFQTSGFEVLEVRSEFAGQYISLEARSSWNPNGFDVNQEVPSERDVTTSGIRTFRRTYAAKITSWNGRLSIWKRMGKRVVLWGSGSKAVAFLNVLQSSPLIEYVVDINIYRQGSFMAGTGQLIVPPDFLCNYHPDVVIIMNSIYIEEIRQHLESLQLRPEMLSL